MSLKKIIALLLALLAIVTVFASCAENVQDIIDVVEDELDVDLPEIELPDDSPEVTEHANAPPETAAPADETDPQDGKALDKNGTYDQKDDVALYIHIYGKLPQNYITKKEAEKLGWSGGSLEPYAPGKCIGGSKFGNYEGLLPDAPGRVWTECDIGTLGKSKRGAKRIVFSNDGLIYYTDDHYESFTLLYGED